jgi:hypothetical protein
LKIIKNVISLIELHPPRFLLQYFWRIWKFFSGGMLLVGS